jgi:hypothetical protein
VADDSVLKAISHHLYRCAPVILSMLRYAFVLSASMLFSGCPQ